MLLAALLDLDRGPAFRRAQDGSPPRSGAPDTLESLLRAAVRDLGVDAELHVERSSEGGFRCTRVVVGGPVSPPLRRLDELETVVDRATLLPPAVRLRSLTALRRLARIEADLHGVSIDEVHFHEIGAVDTLVDVTGVFLLVDALGIDRVEHGPVPLGSGRTRTAHGALGIPAPATLELLRGVPVYAGEEPSETTTPTGALLLTELAAASGPLPHLVAEGIGYGAGSRSLAHGPNLLRAIVGRRASVLASGGPRLEAGLVLLETTIDDSTPEVLTHLQARLVEAGAADVWSTPVSMKKGRHGLLLSVLCPTEVEDVLVDLVFTESSTLGVRRRSVQRYVADREWLTVPVEDRQVRVKVGRWAGRVVTVAPEYEDAARAATALGRPLEEVMRRAAEAARRRLA